ncbi:MAG: tetratricopeptide repeat protein [Kiritimatiellae bacterium]|nr:tetratricopeptide repeat protein [Kiritimatiellia bacterium]
MTGMLFCCVILASAVASGADGAPSAAGLAAGRQSAVSAADKASEDLRVAREALRDGLWDVALGRAAKAGGDEGRAVAAEVLMKQGRWEEALAELDAMRDRSGDAFACNRALVLASLGRGAEAEALLADREFGAQAGMKAAQARVQIAIAAGDAARAASIARTAGLDTGDPIAKMTAAEAYRLSGNREGAVKLWREVASDGNAPPPARSTAACNLEDREVLSAVYAALPDGPARNIAGLRLARILFTSSDPGLFDDGAALARRIVSSDPGERGAMETFAALADAYLDRKAWLLAAEAFRETIEAWPEAARDSSVREGRAWALRKLGRLAEAAEEYAGAAACATNKDVAATAIMERGDVLAEDGKGDEAMAMYRKVLEEYPGTPAADKLKVVVELREIETRGRELYGEFKFDEAREAFAEVARRDQSRKPKMDYLEMLCLYGLCRDDEAVAKAEDLATSCPDAAVRAEASLWLAKFRYNSRDWSRARDLFASYATNMVPDGANAPEAMLWAARAAFSGNDFDGAISIATRLAVRWPESRARPLAMLVQGEALLEMSRLDEAIVVLEKAAADANAPEDARLRAKMLRADAVFAMGADNPARYAEALDAYTELYSTGAPGDAGRMAAAFKIARTLERTGRMDEAIDRYYGDVVCAWLDARRKGTQGGEEEKALFVRAAFRLADEYEKRSEIAQARSMLKLARDYAGGAAAKEAERRMEMTGMKGMSR